VAAAPVTNAPSVDVAYQAALSQLEAPVAPAAAPTANAAYQPVVAPITA
jgi:hypothetical protein